MGWLLLRAVLYGATAASVAFIVVTPVPWDTKFSTCGMCLATGILIGIGRRM